VELVAPTDEEGEVARFIKSRGEGFFLISLKVPTPLKPLENLKENC